MYIVQYTLYFRYRYHCVVKSNTRHHPPSINTHMHFIVFFVAMAIYPVTLPTRRPQHDARHTRISPAPFHHLFWLTGLGGFLWVLLWRWVAYEKPDTHPRISSVERDFIKLCQGESAIVYKVCLGGGNRYCLLNVNKFSFWQIYLRKYKLTNNCIQQQKYAIINCISRYNIE